MSNLGMGIKLLRNRKGFTRVDLARTVNVSADDIYKLEKQAKISFDNPLLQKIIIALETSFPELVLESLEEKDIKRGMKKEFDAIKDPLVRFLRAASELVQKDSKHKRKSKRK